MSKIPKSKIIESLYIHFPFCKHLCNYCDFYKTAISDKNVDLKFFHHYLELSFALHQRLIETNGYSWAPLKTLYIGGGTPSLWGVEGKEFLQKFFKEKGIVLALDCEFTLEVNPGGWNESVLSEWRNFGANRFSLGIQSLNEEMIKKLDRVHSIEDAHVTLSYFKKNDLNFSIDFMLGLPDSVSSGRNVVEEIKQALLYNPSHFSIYILTVKENYTHYGSLPSEEFIEKEYMKVAEFLKSEGFVHYEVSNYARADRMSAHNLNYWKSKTVAALGPSATGFLAEEKIRYKWKSKDAKFDIEYLTEKEYQLEQCYMALRAHGLNLQKLEKKDKRWRDLSRKWLNEGLIEIDEREHLSLTSKGFLLLDSLMNDLFVLGLQ